MSVWLCIPSKRPPEEAAPRLELWRERGYKIALCRDEGEFDESLPSDLAESVLPYPGYAIATNNLIRMVLAADPYASWCVIGGDDVEPDLAHSASEIAAQCREHFGGTLGVMQPTGDRWGDENDGRGAYIDRICGSAWLGREFSERAYGGRGPLWPEYFHMFVDEELQGVAQTLGILWQRRDLIHIHRHWGRRENPRGEHIPQFLRRVNGRAHWTEAQDLFRSRQALGFPGHELAEAAAQ